MSVPDTGTGGRKPGETVPQYLKRTKDERPLCRLPMDADGDTVIVCAMPKGHDGSHGQVTLDVHQPGFSKGCEW